MSNSDYPDLTGVKKILCIKTRHHGDVLLTSPLFSCLRRVFPEAQVDAYIYKDTLPMLEGHPAIRNFHLYDRSWKKLKLFQRLRKEAALLRRIRKAEYDLVLNLTEGDRGALIGLISGAKIRVGFEPGEKKGMLFKKKMLTHKVKDCPTPRHAVERNLDALRRIGIIPAYEERDLFFHVPDEQRLLKPKTRYILIHPVSRWMFKCPPVSFFVELIKALQMKGDQIAISSGPDPVEMEFCKKILDKVEGVLDFSGKMSLKGLGALIEGADALITVDSVPLHLASALKTPTIALFGPTSELNWGPWRNPLAKVVTENMICRPCLRDGCGGSKMSDCMYQIRVSAVIDAFQSLKSSPKYEERASLFLSNSSTVPDMSTLPSRIK
jgi:heptosyltransferase-3